jgi:hypothetical protein
MDTTARVQRVIATLLGTVMKRPLVLLDSTWIKFILTQSLQILSASNVHLAISEMYQVLQVAFARDFALQDITVQLVQHLLLNMNVVGLLSFVLRVAKSQ